MVVSIKVKEVLSGRREARIRDHTVPVGIG
jgi:hypothetical protein